MRHLSISEEIDADVDDQERIILSLAAGELAREDFVNWLKEHCN